MKWILLGAVLLLSACSFTSTTTPTPFGRALFALMEHGAEVTPEGALCVQAAHLKAMQETTLPADEWCQRPGTSTNKKAHECKCHQHSCAKDEVPSAHTDAQCASYCRTNTCRCEAQDCP